MFADLNDTIVAISSPPGPGMRGIVRLSGPDAIRLADSILVSAPGGGLAMLKGHQRMRCRVRIAAGPTLPCDVYLFRSPASYTRQDIVELHTIGSPPLLLSLMESLLDAGARQAEPGEFTARAFFAGALDLTEVEGVAAVIHARTDAQLRASEALLHGRLSRATAAFREQIADLLALVEAQIDFTEEPIEFISGETLSATIGTIANQLDELLAHATSIERLDVLPQAVLVGPPNAGKSTLFNCLCGMDRAIRSAVAGTTRDVLSAPVATPGGDLMLLDSAGLDAARPADHVAAMAQEATKRSIATADVILLVLDAGNAPQEAARRLRAQLAGRLVHTVLNKTDLLPEQAIASLREPLAGEGSLSCVSALDNTGITELREHLGRTLFHSTAPHGTETLALSARQRAALRDARAALIRIASLLPPEGDASLPAELVSIELRDAVSALSLLVGEMTTEDLLGRIFSRFCIGK